MFRLIIDFLLDFGDLVAEDEIKTEILIDFLDTMHDGGVVFDADFGGDFGGTEAELFGEEIHGDLTSGFDVADAGFATHFLGSELEIFGDFVDDLFGVDRMWASGLIDGDGSVLDKFEWCETANFGH